MHLIQPKQFSFSFVIKYLLETEWWLFQSVEIYIFLEHIFVCFIFVDKYLNWSIHIILPQRMYSNIFARIIYGIKVYSTSIRNELQVKNQVLIISNSDKIYHLQPVIATYISQDWHKGSRKKRKFYGQGAGGGGSAPLALTISKCENVCPFLALKFDSLILKTHFISFWGVSKMQFHALCASELGILVIGWKSPFCCVKSVSRHI